MTAGVRNSVDFVAAARATFDHAVERTGLVEHTFALAGAQVAMRFAGPALTGRLLPALAHLPPPTAAAAPRLEVCCFDTESSGTVVSPPEWGRGGLGPKGEILGFEDTAVSAVYDPSTTILNAFDAASSTAVYWVAEAGFVPWWESSIPLRSILHWWAAPTGLQPTHAGAVGVDGTGVLLAGRSGAGKSTTTLACLRAGLDVAGDDFVLVDVDRRVAHSLYCTAKLEGHNTHRFPELVAHISNPHRLTTEKAVLYLTDVAPGQLAAQLGLRAIVLPEVTGRRDSAIRPVSPARALAVLAPTTSLALPGFGAELFAKLNRLVRGLPCFTLEAGTDLDQIPAAIAALLDELP